jgi:hypothetical protein
MVVMVVVADKEEAIKPLLLYWTYPTIKIDIKSTTFTIRSLGTTFL